MERINIADFENIQNCEGIYNGYTLSINFNNMDNFSIVLTSDFSLCFTSYGLIFINEEINVKFSILYKSIKQILVSKNNDCIILTGYNEDI